MEYNFNMNNMKTLNINVMKLMNKFKITWSTKWLKEEGYCVDDVVSYLNDYECAIIEYNGSMIIIKTNKSQEGIYQELRRYFGVEFKVKSV